MPDAEPIPFLADEQIVAELRQIDNQLADWQASIPILRGRVRYLIQKLEPREITPPPPAPAAARTAPS